MITTTLSDPSISKAREPYNLRLNKIYILTFDVLLEFTKRKKRKSKIMLIATKKTLQSTSPCESLNMLSRPSCNLQYY